MPILKSPEPFAGCNDFTRGGGGRCGGGARAGPAPVTRDEAHDHFRRALAGSPWAVLRGWHVFRHSFCSNCAAAGIDQRLIDAWVGHQTEEMRKRYRHSFPDQRREAVLGDDPVNGPKTSSEG